MISNKRQYWPSRFILQWHITDQCNQHCMHCYGDTERQEDLDFERLERIYREYLDFLSIARRQAGHAVPSRLVIAGGEPFVRDDCIDFLDMVSARPKLHSLAILTNGTLIDEPIARFLGRIQPMFVQVSIEGRPDTHDRIRGAGNYERVVKAVQLLVRHRVRVSISFTARADNYTEFPDVVALGRSLHVHKVWTDRMIPCGQSLEDRDQVLSPDQTKEYVSLIRADLRRDRLAFWRHSVTSANRALQYHASGHAPYACSAGDGLLTILCDGTVVPCRRMPIALGSVFDQRLVDLYQDDEQLIALRSDVAPEECLSCSNAGRCRGGLRCLAYAMYGSPYQRDPGCWAHQ